MFTPSQWYGLLFVLGMAVGALGFSLSTTLGVCGVVAIVALMVRERFNLVK